MTKFDNVLGTEIVQVVYEELRKFVESDEIIPWDDTKPQHGEGAKVLELNVYPRKADSHLLVEVIIHAAEGENKGNHIIVALFQDNEPDAIAASCAQVLGNIAQYGGLNSIPLRHVIHLEEKPTVKLIVRAGLDFPGRININGGEGRPSLGGTLISSITVTEIARLE